jgi:F0F1-type ATP synthase membrane subunit c/vacuolar-type H+-ATPase subunit K
MKINWMHKNMILFFIAYVMFACVMGYLAGLFVQSLTVTALSTQPSIGILPLQTEPVDTTDYTIVGIAIAAALAISIPGIGASMGMATTSAAALGAITERPEVFGKTVLYVVFIEAVAIYGFVIAFLLVSLIPPQ